MTLFINIIASVEQKLCGWNGSNAMTLSLCWEWSTLSSRWGHFIWRVFFFFLTNSIQQMEPNCFLPSQVILLWHPLTLKIQSGVRILYSQLECCWGLHSQNALEVLGLLLHINQPAPKKTEYELLILNIYHVLTLNMLFKRVVHLNPFYFFISRQSYQLSRSDL